MSARPYQTTLKGQVYDAWSAGAKNVLMRLDTGGGKTFILGEIHQEHQGASCVTAHRQELVSQLSGALAEKGVRHGIIGADATIKACVNEHLGTVGRSFYDPGAKCRVASVDTLVRADGLSSWASQVTLSTIDEAHHVVTDNKWDTAQKLFTHPLCRGLGPTATPLRADGKGLGRGYGGIYDVMVQGPEMRWLIDEGYLTDYDIACPTSDLAVLEDAGASGDWTSKQLREAAQRSHIVGDVVQNYLKFARGKLGITFATDVETAAEITLAYQRAGVRAAVLTGKTDGGVRRQMLRDFARREIDMIVAVDIISEGFDLPAIEVAIFARPTQSLALYMQQFGRALRAMFAQGFDLSTQAGRLAAIAASTKQRALIIDLVANTLRHRVPDLVRAWSLMPKGKRGGGGGIPLRICTNPVCVRPYERFFVECPYCGTPIPPPVASERGFPAAVEGDVALMDAALLAALRGDIERTVMPMDAFRLDAAARRVPPIGIMAQAKHHYAKLEAQGLLWEAIGHFGGSRLGRGRGDREMQREFFHLFGVDVLTARTLDAVEALALRDRIRSAI